MDQYNRVSLKPGSGKGCWALYWYPKSEGLTDGVFVCITIFCPGCGKEGTLSKHVHKIADDGTVTPSDVCPFPPCTFHRWIKLEGWVGPDRRTV